MKFVFDTDHISILQRQAGQEYVKLVARIAQYSRADFTVSVVSFHEQVLGAHTYIHRARRSSDVIRGYAMLDDVLQSFRPMLVLAFDGAAAAIFDSLATQKLRVGTMDLRIAAIALSRNLVVLTRNIRDFTRVP